MNLVRFGFVCRAVMAMLVVTSSVVARAHFPASFGRDFVVVGGGADIQSADARPLPLRTVIDAEAAGPHQQLLADLELQGGPFAAGLYEPLTMLGRLHRDSGDYRGAAALYRRALHTIRVNEGLLGEQQLPVLQELIALYRQGDEWALVDQAYDDYLRVIERGSVSSAEVSRQGVLEYISWQREALQRGIDNDRNARLVAMYDTTRRLLDEVASDTGAERSWQRQLVFMHLDILYLILGELPVDEQAAGRSDSGERIGGVTRSPEYIRQRMTRLQQAAVALGRDLLTGYLQQWPESTALEKAQVGLALADWYQWNDRLQSAERTYLEVITALRESGNSELQRQWFELATELPAHSVFLPRFAGVERPAPIIAHARFRVSARGNVSDIDITLADPAQQSGGSYGLRQMLRGTHFRPKMLADGSRVECVLSRNYRLFR